MIKHGLQSKKCLHICLVHMRSHLKKKNIKVVVGNKRIKSRMVVD